MTVRPDIQLMNLAQGERLSLAIKAFVLLKLAALFILAINTRFVMDEFWHFTQPVYLFDGIFETIWPKKAVGYAVFYEFSHLIGWDATSMLMVGRLTTACLAVAICWCIYRCSRALGAEAVTALLAVALLLSFSNFIERGFRLRSEPLATLFGALAVLVIIRCETDRLRTLFIAGLLSGFAFVTTQKSVYFNFALGAALTIDALCMRSVTQAIRRGGVLISGWVAAIAVYALLLGGSAAPQVLTVLFMGPTELALNGGSYYEGLDAYVWQTLLRNPLQYGLIAYGLFLAGSRFFHSESAKRIFFVYTVLLSSLVFFHNQTWPYVFIMALPFLAVYGALALVHLMQHSERTLSIVPAILVIIAVQSVVRNVQYLGHDNRAQIALVQEVETRVELGETYFDGIGMVPSRRMEPRLWLDAEAVRKTILEGQSSALYDALSRAEPDLVISTYRSESLGAVFNSALKEHYGFVSPNIMLPLDSNADLLNSWAERVQLFDGVYSD